jgi:diguanylate cyclase (GGDEF)-like protein
MVLRARPALVSDSIGITGRAFCIEGSWVSLTTDQIEIKSAEQPFTRVNDPQGGLDALLQLVATELHESSVAWGADSLDSIQEQLVSLRAQLQRYSQARRPITSLPPQAKTTPEASGCTDRSLDLSVVCGNNWETGAEGVALLSAQGVVRRANQSLGKMASQNADRLIGKSLADILQLDNSEFVKILGRVTSGMPWFGKAAAELEGERSYWISLSPYLCSSEADNQISVKSIVALISDVTEEDLSERNFRRQALHDNLTGLPNRRYFRSHLQDVLASQGTHGHIAFIDVDDFKTVNDCTGHANGDLLLIAVGERIQEVLGPHAFVARLGGDEFGVILTMDGLEQTQRTAPYEQLLLAFREPFPLNEIEAVVGLSIGVAEIPSQSIEAETLISRADAAMYASKSAGKNQVQLFTAALYDAMLERQRVQSKLRRALIDGQIELWYQPKVDALTNRPVGCEALARWKTPGGEYIPPNQFIPIAEQTGLIAPLGEKVFRLAAMQACQWKLAGHLPFIAVNVSPQQLRHPRFVTRLETILEETGAQPNWFELEITENAVMDDVEHAVRVIDRLEEVGFRIAIDDFGTGYSSLSYLKNFNIHTLKIDLSFVRDLTRDRQSNAIVKSIISLGTGLNLTLVAEGVETHEQAEFLRDAGCDILQGYLIGKPLPSDQYLLWLENWKKTHSCE